MVHVASEMERLGVNLPLLIGGATTSKLHTAIKIDPERAAPVIHVVDASRAVGVVGQLVSDALRDDFIADVAQELETVRERRAAKTSARERLSLEAARANRMELKYDPIAPSKPGVHVIEQPVLDLRPFIDWTPFFHTWQLKGRYPAILEHPEMARRRPSCLLRPTGSSTGQSGNTSSGRGLWLGFFRPTRSAMTLRFTRTSPAP
jgi:5-methyltetrahydrofolate--homocysteine methyltransferase